MGDRGPGDGSRPVDEVAGALEALVDALQENLRSTEVALRRARVLRQQRGRGLAYRQILEGEPGPLMVELITGNLERLRRHGARFRRAITQALHDEGMTMDDIAELYGVSRQRVSALLRGIDPEGD